MYWGESPVKTQMYRHDTGKNTPTQIMYGRDTGKK